MKQYKVTENNITYDIYEYVSGNKYWILNGKRHRENGPAIEYANGEKNYWYNGKYLIHINSDEELKRYIKLLSIS